MEVHSYVRASTSAGFVAHLLFPPHPPQPVFLNASLPLLEARAPEDALFVRDRQHVSVADGGYRDGGPVKGYHVARSIVGGVRVHEGRVECRHPVVATLPRRASGRANRERHTGRVNADAGSSLKVHQAPSEHLASDLAYHSWPRPLPVLIWGMPHRGYCMWDPVASPCFAGLGL